MFPITITLHNIAELKAVVAVLDRSPDLATHASRMAAEAQMADTVDTPQPKAEAPGKRSDATTAPSPRTVEAAPSTPAPSAAAPASSTEVTPPAAGAASAPQQVTYPDLQKAVLTLHKADPTAAVPIAKSLGADTFKALTEDKWAEALRLVNEAIEARKAA